MSSTRSGCAPIVTKHVPRDANRYRWHVLRYVRACTYPASVTELSEAIAPAVGTQPRLVKKTLQERDLPTLADCNAIEYDLESQLVCLPEAEKSAVDCVRRAIRAGAISHLKPPWYGLDQTDTIDFSERESCTRRNGG